MSHDKKLQKNLDRRLFLKSLASLPVAGKFHTPFQLFLVNCFSGFIEKAFAQSAGEVDLTSQGKFLATIFMNGGFPHWYHIPLRPHANSAFNANPFLGTKFQENSINLEYTNTNITHSNFNNILMPHWWGGNIPYINANGSITSVPNSILAQNMCMIRGVAHNQDEHGAASKKMLMATGSASLAGAIADQSSAPYSSYSLGYDTAHMNLSRDTFVSRKGKIQYGDRVKDNPNPMLTLLSSFNMPNSHEVTKENFRSAFATLLNFMKENAAEYHQYLPTSYVQRNIATSLMNANFTQLADSYISTRNKYRTLISESFHNPNFNVDGVHNKTLPGSASLPQYRMKPNGVKGFYTGTNFNSCFTSNISPNITIPAMAEAFAMGELLVLNKLSSHVNIFCSDMDKINFGTNTFRTESGTDLTLNNYWALNDAHDYGRIPHIVIFNHYLTALSACTNQLQQSYKNNYLNSSTSPWSSGGVILRTSEFGQVPMAVGSFESAEHAPYASWADMFHKDIDKLALAGRIMLAPGSTSLGHFGYGAPSINSNTVTLGVGNIHSTVCHLLGATSPTPTDSSVLTKLSTGKFVKSASVGNTNV